MPNPEELIEPPFMAELHAIREEAEGRARGMDHPRRITERRRRVEEFLASAGYRLEPGDGGERLRPIR